MFLKRILEKNHEHKHAKSNNDAANSLSWVELGVLPIQAYLPRHAHGPPGHSYSLDILSIVTRPDIIVQAFLEIERFNFEQGRLAKFLVALWKRLRLFLPERGYDPKVVQYIISERHVSAAVLYFCGLRFLPRKPFHHQVVGWSALLVLRRAKSRVRGVGLILRDLWALTCNR